MVSSRKSLTSIIIGASRRSSLKNKWWWMVSRNFVWSEVGSRTSIICHNMFKRKINKFRIGFSSKRGYFVFFRLRTQTKNRCSKDLNDTWSSTENYRYHKTAIFLLTWLLQSSVVAFLSTLYTSGIIRKTKFIPNVLKRYLWKQSIHQWILKKWITKRSW